MLRFQSTRPVWGATMILSAAEYLDDISIHAPRVGRDSLKQTARIAIRYFNPRAPCGARQHFSLHHRSDGLYFNPRAPCGARRHWRTNTFPRSIFQSTRPVWGATMRPREQKRVMAISIHAPRVGRDTPFWRSCQHFLNFNPRAPCGARLDSYSGRFCRSVISIHAPRVGRDVAVEQRSKHTRLFQSTRPVWGATIFHSPEIPWE